MSDEDIWADLERLIPLALHEPPLGVSKLSAILRKHGFTLAAYLTAHEKHLLNDEVYSDCRECSEERGFGAGR